MGQRHPMSEADGEIQAAARALPDELLPHEVTAELAGGELPEELAEAHRRRVAELGFEAINMPRSWAAAASPPSSRCWSRNRWAG